MPGLRPLTLQSPALIGVIVAVLVIGIVAAGMISFAFGSAFPFSGFFFAPFCGIFVFVIFLIVIIVLASQSQSRSWIPPPPPIQQPMVPAGAQGPVALNCPNCGAPPRNVDRFGVATCPYCNTRFLVR